MSIKQNGKTILIVEDDQEIGEIIVEVLSEETRHRAHLVTNAYEALKIVKDLLPDLFLLDYQLPNMTGLQLLDQLYATEQFKSIPTIIMSANLPQDELVKRNIIGLAKPFDLDHFIGLIKRMIA